MAQVREMVKQLDEYRMESNVNMVEHVKTINENTQDILFARYVINDDQRFSAL